MANNAKMYNMLISCPGDVENMIQIVDEVIENFNQQFIDTLGIGIITRYWKKSAYAQSGGNPQELLNKQFVEKCDLAIAIFKTRFGTPTDRYGSGSEEEIEIMLRAEKQVFMFFDESPIEHDKIDIQQLQKVREFKDKYKEQKRGILWIYKSTEEFRNIFNAQVTRYFLVSQTVQDMQNNCISNLVIKSYFQKKMYDDAILTKFDMGMFVKSNEILDVIKKLFERIPKYKLSQDNYYAAQMLEKQVELPKDVIEWIEICANKLGYEIEKNFFALGGLKESIISVSLLYGGKDLIGTDDEKSKYNDLIELRDEIKKLIGHMQVENYYSNLVGIQFIVCNNGTQYDEDIDIEVYVPKEIIMLHNELDVPSEALDCHDWCFEDIFEIPACKDFINYVSTLEKSQPYISSNNQLPLFTSVDYEEEYRDILDEIFDYTVYEDDDNVIIKVHMDYLKQHNNAAFPTWIFLRNVDKYPNIEYKISSKNRPEVINGVMKVEIKDV